MARESPSAAGGGCTLLGVRLDRVTFREALDRMEAFATGRSPRRVVTVNLDFLARARSDEGFRDVLNGADLRVADGMPLVWASRLLGEPLPERVAGVDLFEAFAQRAAARGIRLFLLGARPGVADAAAAVLRSRHPSLRVVGTYSPPEGFENVPEQDAEAARRVEEARPDALFLAVSTPRGEKWIARLLERVPVPLAVNVGSAFDVVVEPRRRSPRALRRLGLEWLYRLLREPRRLWRRYLVADAGVVLPLFTDAFRRRGAR